jgi:hypothetical protein
MARDDGRPEDCATCYRASPEFMTAVRVCDTGDAESIMTLLGAPGGWTMGLLPPEPE